MPVTVDAMSTINCTCPCGCPDTTTPTGSSVLDKYTRCPRCLIEHSDQASQKPPTSAWQRAGSNDATDPFAEVRAKQVEEHTQALWWQRAKTWHDALPAKFRAADRMDDPGLSAATNHMRSGRPGLAGLVVRGTAGTGKTWLAMSYVKVLVRDRLVDPGAVLVGTEAELLASLTQQATWDMGRDLAQLINPRWKVVFIDDVGVGLYRSETAKRGVWHPLIDAMYAENRTIVLSTELSMSALRSYLGESVYTRIRSLCAGSIIELSEDQRLVQDAPKTQVD